MQRLLEELDSGQQRQDALEVQLLSTPGSQMRRQDSVNPLFCGSPEESPQDPLREATDLEEAQERCAQLEGELVAREQQLQVRFHGAGHV